MTPDPLNQGLPPEPDESEPMDAQALLAMQAEDASLLTPEESEALAEASAPSPPSPEEDFYANLAEHMDEGDLGVIASRVIQWVRFDDMSREDWRKREAKGIQMLGVSE